MYSRAKNSLDFVVILHVLFDNPIAFASGFLQAGPIQDFDLATTIVDVSSTLKFLCGHARGRAPHRVEYLALGTALGDLQRSRKLSVIDVSVLASIPHYR